MRVLQPRTTTRQYPKLGSDVPDSSIGARLRRLREEKSFSQGDVEKATGMLRCYISRVENGHTVPSLETLERFAAAFEVPLFRLFYAGEEPPPAPAVGREPTLEELAAKSGREGSDARFLLKLRKLVGRMSPSDRDVLLTLAKKLAAR